LRLTERKRNKENLTTTTMKANYFAFISLLNGK